MSLVSTTLGTKPVCRCRRQTAIEEFIVQTGLYDAEFGRKGGAVMNM